MNNDASVVSISGSGSGEISLGETLIATATLLAPMMYALSKKPELVEQLQELYQPNFLEEENIEEAETVRKPNKKATIVKEEGESIWVKAESESDADAEEITPLD